MTRVLIPVFFLAPRSLLEHLGDMLMHVDLLDAPEYSHFIIVHNLMCRVQGDDPYKRFMCILKWYLSSWHYKTHVRFSLLSPSSSHRAGLQEALQPHHRRDLFLHRGHGRQPRELRGRAGEPPPARVRVLPGEPEAGLLRERVHLDQVALHGEQRLRLHAGQYRGLFPAVRRSRSPSLSPPRNSIPR